MNLSLNRQGMSKTKTVLAAVAMVALVVQAVMSAWWAFNREINFSSDIARDFFLLDELDRKKIILIGPNSSTGLFHGPLWTYLNYPAYKLGHGDPAAVAWFWVLLALAFTVGNYFIGRKLIGRTGGALFALMSSLYMVFHVRDMYNPHGAMLLMPLFFFLFVRYLQTRKWVFLAAGTVTGSALIQFQMAVGIPLVGLFGLATLITAIRYRKFWHIAAYLFIPLCLANFIIFDLRHGHLLLTLLKHFLDSPGRDRPDYLFLLKDRMTMMLTSPEIARANMGWRNPVLFGGTLLVIVDQIRRGKNRVVYLSFLYMYVGFFLLALVNTGPMLYFYLFPMFPLVFLVFSSLIDSRIGRIFAVVFLVVYAVNFRQALYDIQVSPDYTGKSLYSWQFHARMDRKLFEENVPEFGYFVYSPNTLAYEGKYGMQFTQTLFPNQHAHYFTKMPVTYLVVAPPPPDHPFMGDLWWRQNRVMIDTEPVSTVRYPNGYKVEKYLLTEEQTKVPFDPGIDPGLTFR